MLGLRTQGQASRSRLEFRQVTLPLADAFREYTHGTARSKHLKEGIKGRAIVDGCTAMILPPPNGDCSQAPKYKTQDRILKQDVCCSEAHGASAKANDHHRINQRVLVVPTKNDRPVLGNIVDPCNLDVPKVEP
jgi:hypothetical protein